MGVCVLFCTAALGLALAERQRPDIPHSLSSISLKVVDLMEAGVSKYLEEPNFTESPKRLLQRLLTDFSSLKSVLQKMKAEDEERSKLGERSNAENLEIRKDLENDNRHLEETMKAIVDQRQKCEKALEEAGRGNMNTKDGQEIMEKLSGEQMTALLKQNGVLKQSNTKLHEQVHSLTAELMTTKKNYENAKMEDGDVKNLRLQNQNLMNSVRKLMHDEDKENLRRSRQLLEQERAELVKETAKLKDQRAEEMAKEDDEKDHLSDVLDMCTSQKKSCETELQSLRSTQTLCASETTALVNDKKHLMDTISNLLRNRETSISHVADHVREEEGRMGMSSMDASISAHSTASEKSSVSTQFSVPGKSSFPATDEEGDGGKEKVPPNLANFDIQDMGKTADIDAYVAKTEVALEHEPRKVFLNRKQPPPAVPKPPAPKKKVVKEEEPIMVLPKHIPQVNLSRLPANSALREYMGIPVDPALGKEEKARKAKKETAEAAMKKLPKVMQHELERKVAEEKAKDKSRSQDKQPSRDLAADLLKAAEKELAEVS